MHNRHGLGSVLILFCALIVIIPFSIFVSIKNITEEWSPLLEQRIRSRQQVSTIRVLAKNQKGEDEWISSIVGGHAEVRKNVPLAEVNPMLLEAIVSLEDPRFLSHGGFDVFGIARAAFKNLINLRYKEGASTLTQQLVKNLFLTQEKTLMRKFKEIVLSILVEKRFQKEEILEAYLNEVFMGQVEYPDVLGIQKAAEFYFGKDQSQLEVHEVALISAMVAGSGFYSPFKHPDRALARRNKVLNILLNAEKITQEEFDSALKLPLPKEPHPSFRSKASYAIDEIRDSLVKKDGELRVVLGGYDVQTTLDADLQRQSEELFLKESKTWPKQLQVALVGIDPRTCEYKVYQGGTSYTATQYNRLTRAKRPPGSLIKPLLLAPIISKNSHIHLAKLIQDEEFTWTYDKGRGQWSPKNYDRKYRGTVSLRTTLEQSLNIPFTKIFQELEPNGLLKDIFSPVVNWGLDIPDNRALPSALLGSVEQKPLDMARAYVSLVRTALGYQSLNDTACTPSFLPKEISSDFLNANKTDQAGALLTLEAMQGVVRRGSARVLGSQLPTNQEWAGKTGTSSDKRDAWFVLASPELVLLAWMGMDQNIETDFTGAWLSSHLIAPLIKNYSENFPDGFSWPINSQLVWKVIDLERGCEYPGAYARELREKFSNQIKSKEGLPNEAIVDGHHLAFELFKESDELSYCR
ncbi:MAG: transglycosylase domain-containing protein [bacterium]